MDRLRAKIRDIPNFPKPGIVFKDLTPVIADGRLLGAAVAGLIAPFKTAGVTAVAGMEARGFIFGSLAAYALGVGFIPLRKPGKLPHLTHQVAYALEYGSAALEIHVDALTASDTVLLVDDLIATGGTAAASCELVRKSGASIAGCAFVIELDFLKGRQVLAEVPVHSLIHYAS
ncbi:MAG: adenine phosphoribosyltransferase [Gammaproteobacteria bacterium]|nr:adenine phosphoribosyltransferase [Gammaproteobacteria bacterium]